MKGSWQKTGNKVKKKKKTEETGESKNQEVQKWQKPYKKAHNKEALVTAPDKRVSEKHKLRETATN